ncbi:MAG: hypothetical protein SCI25_00130 [Desulfuromonadales bacterium]|nr:hypothetical protein [Desulfuromonadales bacterium]
MHPPDTHPLDVLAECVCKSAFLADAVNSLSVRRDELSDQGLEGLGFFLSEIERDIRLLKTILEEKEA